MSKMMSSAIGRVGVENLLPDIAEEARTALAVKIKEAGDRVSDVLAGGLTSAAGVVDKTAVKRLKIAEEKAIRGKRVDEAAVVRDMGALSNLADLRDKALPPTPGGAGGQGTSIIARNVILNRSAGGGF
jgi:hypothetical protein